LEKLPQTPQFALERDLALELINVVALEVILELNAKPLQSHALVNNLLTLLFAIQEDLALQRIHVHATLDILEMNVKLLLALERHPLIQQFALGKDHALELINALVLEDILELNVKLLLQQVLQNLHQNHHHHLSLALGKLLPILMFALGKELVLPLINAHATLVTQEINAKQ
jgi:hypothetical protein